MTWPHCFCGVNHVLLMLTSCIYMTKADRSVSKQGHLQPRCHSKARTPSRQMWNGLFNPDWLPSNITWLNHQEHIQPVKPIKTPGEDTLLAQSAGKRMKTSHDCFRFHYLNLIRYLSENQSMCKRSLCGPQLIHAKTYIKCNSDQAEVRK